MRQARADKDTDGQRQTDRAAAQIQQDGSADPEADRGVGILAQRPTLARAVKPVGEGLDA